MRMGSGEDFTMRNLIASLNITWVVKTRRWTGHVTRMEKREGSLKYVRDKPTGNRPLQKPRRRREDKIRIDLKEIYINMRHWIDSAQGGDYWRALLNSICHGVSFNITILICLAEQVDLK